MNRTIPMRAIEGSSAIIAEGYDPVTKTLTLQFTRAKEPVVVEDVSPATYQQFLAAESKGRFFHEHFK